MIRKDSLSWQVAMKVYKSVFQGVIKQKREPQLAEELNIPLFFCNELIHVTRHGMGGGVKKDDLILLIAEKYEERKDFYLSDDV